MDYAALLQLIVHIKKSSNVYIFGTGRGGKALCDFLTCIGIRVNGFIDNHPSKHGQLLQNVQIHPANVLSPFQSDRLILVASIYFHDIADQLEQFGYHEGVHFVDALTLSNIPEPDNKGTSTTSRSYRKLVKQALSELEKGIPWEEEIHKPEYRAMDETFIAMIYLANAISLHVPTSILDMGGYFFDPVLNVYLGDHVKLFDSADLQGHSEERFDLITYRAIDEPFDIHDLAEKLTCEGRLIVFNSTNVLSTKEALHDRVSIRSKRVGNPFEKQLWIHEIVNEAEVQG